MSVNIQYSMIIQWSDEDKCYIASLPEFGPFTKTHGATYAEAARMGQEVLEMLIEIAISQGEALPLPQKFHDEFAAEFPLAEGKSQIETPKTRPTALSKSTRQKSRKSKVKSHATA